jgi:uncharacterized protein (DUF2141 family)
MRIISIVFVAFLIAAATPTQIFTTSLTITVRDELGNAVANASIKLFESEENYNQEKNPIAEGVTDAKGILKVKKLKAIPYFVLVKKEDKDNTNGGEKISPLEEGKFNKVTIVIQ